VSKNVAVFVDVANIFYAAKAAGVDIDYVTLLKSSIAGRDFVRAYAYTGLDPENENQRQFHSFLARNGYKVVSKDIRKYGDGRIKANLDIELVVDMMRMAQHLDIAVVVSGDGDFAPAIRAVQQMGVRVEVVSFRGNTSSDLIEVADAFTDIAQIARVEKGSARSGRRVAAEGDLSMTEVPEKETEGAPRRRRGRARGGDTETAAAASVAPAGVAAETTGMPGNLIVLPGERLSRAPDDVEADELPAEDEMATGQEEPADEADLESTDDAAADGRRRRRRRGGRGRGRRRDTAEAGLEGATSAAADADADADEAEDDDEDFEAPQPAQLPHQTFGSVWDTQLGVPTAPIPTTADVFTTDDEEDYEDEPEVPEYLLAERRQRGQQRGQRGRMGGRGGRAAGYQAAVERERYGRGGGFSAPRLPERQRGDRQRPGRQQPGRPPQRSPRQEPRSPRQDQRPPREQRLQERQAPAASGQPWSEVPPEVEELLRAELARQAPAPAARAPEPASETGAGEAGPPSAEVEAAVDAAPKRRPTRRRSTKEAAAEATAPSEEAAQEPAVPAKPARATRRRAPAKSAVDGQDGPATPAEPSAETATEEAAPKPKRASRSRKAASTAADEGAADSGSTAEGDQPEPEKKPTRRRRTKAAEAADSEPPAEG
jgi:uncharacterized LabA/DUF88 family protein